MEQERGIPCEFIADKIAEAITVAARKDYGGNDIVSCIIDVENEIFSVTARKEVGNLLLKCLGNVSLDIGKAFKEAIEECEY